MVKNFYIKFFVSIFLLTITSIHAQQPDTDSLQKRVRENVKLFETDPDQAFIDSDILLEKVVATKDYYSELELLAQRCWYYYYISDIENLIISSRLLQKKAIEYKNSHFEANAHIYLLAAFEINQLQDKAIAEFNKAMTILEKENQKDEKIITSKIKAYIYLSNLYNFNLEPQKALQQQFLASKESEKLEDSEKKKESQFRIYSIIGATYLNIDIDSCEYYVKKSMGAQPEKGLKYNDVVFLNYSLLGDLQRTRKNYKEALVYYHKAEGIIPESNSYLTNRQTLFKVMEWSYKALSDTLNANHYAMKIKETELEITQNKYKSLHKILEDNKEQDNTLIYYIVFGLGLTLIGGTAFFIYRLKKKNKLLQEYEKKSDEYLDTSGILSKNSGQLNKELVEMVEDNDPKFMEFFHKVFPDFTKKLRLINPSIVDTEIEFCTFLKLNMPTKDIARCKNIDPRSVQNRKYRIRKKLNIPNNIDIYLYFSQF